MSMTPIQAVITIAVIFLATVLTRFLPFILFPDDKPTPKIIEYLGKVLPYAAIGMLVVFCLKNITITQHPFGLPELISVGVVALLHMIKKNTLLSIAGGTICYMLLVQFVFI